MGAIFKLKYSTFTISIHTQSIKIIAKSDIMKHDKYTTFTEMSRNIFI